MNNKYQRGAQILEFALVLPLLLIILLMIVDFGFLVYNKAVITNASREAARYGTVLTAIPWSVPSIKSVACNYSKNSLINLHAGGHTEACGGGADPEITVSNPNGNVPPIFGDPITVQINYPYAGFLNSATAWISVPSWNLTAVSTMNHE